MTKFFYITCFSVAGFMLATSLEIKYFIKTIKKDDEPQLTTFTKDYVAGMRFICFQTLGIACGGILASLTMPSN